MITAPPGASSASTCTGTPGSRSSPGVPPARIRSRSRRPPSARADFAGWCPTTQPVDECFAPLSAYAWCVEEVREELQHARGIGVQRVVLTSDETNATWWEEVQAARLREGGTKEVGGGEPNRILGTVRG
ncbi:hypothetical protein B0H14DRAFT_3024835 [Mycena olivaceomarginata]|nr:hypothetical protein B0H14DRAFT_3024835 [Mycena olivaceomarginata]